MQRDLVAGGHVVAVVPDGAAALTAITGGQADALVVALPPALAQALCRQLRQPVMAPPILLVTGNVAAGVAGLAAGADAYLVAPVAPLELHAWVRRRNSGGARPHLRS